MTKKDIEDIIKIICPDDEDFEKPCISPMYLRKELEALALEQEDCISRQAVLDVIEREEFKGDAISEIEKLSSVIPQPKTGHWNTYELAQGGINEKWLECSECMWSNALLIPRNYCPKCGARMMEKEDDKE